MLLLLLLLVLAGAAAWADKRGYLGILADKRLAAAIGVVAAIMLVKGEFLPGLAAGAIAAFLATRAPRAVVPGLPLQEARDLLGVSADADEPAIRSAHRRLVAKVHPDAGGSAELARRVNAARDVLLGELKKA